MGIDREMGWAYRRRVQHLQSLEDGGEGLVKLEVVLLPSSKEEDEAEVV